MKDFALVAPILIAGGTFLFALQEPGWRESSHRTEELMFLSFLFGLLFAWHRGKRVATERLKALELGYNVAEGLHTSPERTALFVGIWTPVCLLGMASVATAFQPEHSSAIWVAAILFGMTTLICGTILLLVFRTTSPSPTRDANFPSRVILKPKADPDEFDVAGQRGSNGHPSEERS